ncbi:type II toxin-antitoxin system MqsR family toxin [Dyella sp.]|uniref:type II toxin-antitoxin system MqsR family toxin n=1 Tax=Dyella sp. TaxID=1869338 RepID=UPI0039C866F0
MPGSPIYDLDRVKVAGARGNLVLTRQVQRDYQELGYGLSDVHECVASLELSDYRGVAEYGGVKYDVYHPRYRGPSGCVDELYVKLAARAEATVPQAAIASFHLQRKG